MSTRDHPDWWKNIGGQNSQDSILERRSLIWNDNEIEDGAVPATFYEALIYKGKFFTRGCRGMIEQLQLYCIGDGVDEITLRYSPHPCLGPFGEVTIVPAAGWAWQAFVIEEMWNYDSLFIWVYEAEANVDWAYDAVLPFDGHLSADVGVTWSDMAIRPFIRAVYTGETPGDVPVSGVINNVRIPNTSAGELRGTENTLPGIEVILATIDGAGTCDYVLFTTLAQVAAEQTEVRVYADGAFAFRMILSAMNADGFTPSTPGCSLTTYAVGGVCGCVITRQIDFRRQLTFAVFSPVGGITVSCSGYANILA